MIEFGVLGGEGGGGGEVSVHLISRGWEGKESQYIKLKGCKPSASEECGKQFFVFH